MSSYFCNDSYVILIEGYLVEFPTGCCKLHVHSFFQSLARPRKDDRSISALKLYDRRVVTSYHTDSITGAADRQDAALPIAENTVTAPMVFAGQAGMLLTMSIKIRWGEPIPTEERTAGK